MKLIFLALSLLLLGGVAYAEEQPVEYRSPIRETWREEVKKDPNLKADIEAALRESGLGEGDTVFFQAGMAAFGTIEGGPQAVIDSLRGVVGDRALIAMPAFPLTGPALEPALVCFGHGKPLRDPAAFAAGIARLP